MKTKIIRVGNSKGIIISSDILKLLGLDERAILHISITENPPQLILRPTEGQAASVGLHRQKMEEIEKFLELYDHLAKGL